MAKSKRTKAIPVPTSRNNVALLPIERVVDYNLRTPIFCFAHLRPGFAVKDLDKSRRGSLASRLEELSQLTWGEISRQPRHKFGTEHLPAVILRTALPAKFADEDQVVVLRYFDRLPMVGIRIHDIFHVIAIEANYGDLYDHGS